MSAKLPPAQAAILEAVIARFPEGATLEQIAQALTPVPSDRTLSRWLTALSEAHRVERIGQARNTRYRALHPPRQEVTHPTAVVAPSEPIAAQRESRWPDDLAACPPKPGADLTEQIFAAAIGDIVRFKMSRATAVMVLQRMTELNIASVDDRRACLTLLKARLAAFTEAEAERYGLEPEQYRAWSENDALMTAPGGAGAVPDNAQRPTSNIQHPTSKDEGDGNEVGRDRRARRMEDVATNGGASLPSVGPAKEGGPALLKTQAAGYGLPSEGRAKEGDPALQQTAKPVPNEERHQPRPTPKAERPTSYRAAGDISNIQHPTSKDEGDGNEVGRDRRARRVADTVAESGRKAPPTGGSQAERPTPNIQRPTSKEGSLSTALNAGEFGGGRDGRFGPDGRRDACAPSGDPKNQPAPNDAVSGFQQTATDMKRLMTPGRLAVSALWAGGVSTAATHLVGGGAAQAVTFLMAGVPPLLFVDRDRVAANNPMDLRAKLTTLVAGGSGSMLVASPVSYVFESALGMFR